MLCLLPWCVPGVGSRLCWKLELSFQPRSMNLSPGREVGRWAGAHLYPSASLSGAPLVTIVLPEGQQTHHPTSLSREVAPPRTHSDHKHVWLGHTLFFRNLIED